MRRAAKRDANEAAIVAALERIGCVVRRLNQDGLPDLLVACRGMWTAMEVKEPGGKLTRAQAKLMRLAPFPVVHSVDEALQFLERSRVWERP